MRWHVCVCVQVREIPWVWWCSGRSVQNLSHIHTDKTTWCVRREGERRDRWLIHPPSPSLPFSPPPSTTPATRHTNLQHKLLYRVGRTFSAPTLGLIPIHSLFRRASSIQKAVVLGRGEVKGHAPIGEPSYSPPLPLFILTLGPKGEGEIEGYGGNPQGCSIFPSPSPGKTTTFPLHRKTMLRQGGPSHYCVPSPTCIHQAPIIREKPGWRMETILTPPRSFSRLRGTACWMVSEGFRRLHGLSMQAHMNHLQF